MIEYDDPADWSDISKDSRLLTLSFNFIISESLLDIAELLLEISVVLSVIFLVFVLS